MTPGLPYRVSRHQDGRGVCVPVLPGPGRGGRDDRGRREAAGGRGAGRGQAEQDKHNGQQVICKLEKWVHYENINMHLYICTSPSPGLDPFNCKSSFHVV